MTATQAVLDLGSAVGVYPGTTGEAHRPSSGGG